MLQNKDILSTDHIYCCILAAVSPPMPCTLLHQPVSLPPCARGPFGPTTTTPTVSRLPSLARALPRSYSALSRSPRVHRSSRGRPSPSTPEPSF